MIKRLEINVYIYDGYIDDVEKVNETISKEVSETLHKTVGYLEPNLISIQETKRDNVYKIVVYYKGNI